MNSGQNSKKLSLCKWPVGCYLQVGLKVLISCLYIPALAAPLNICWINGDFKVLRSLWRILMLIKAMLVVQVYLIYTLYICWKLQAKGLSEKYHQHLDDPSHWMSHENGLLVSNLSCQLSLLRCNICSLDCSVTLLARYRIAPFLQDPANLFLSLYMMFTCFVGEVQFASALCLASCSIKEKMTLFAV